MTTETEIVNGEPVTVRRLSVGDAEMARNEFVWFMHGQDCSDEVFDDAYLASRIVYRDNYDTGESEYQVVDAEGHGDGSGTWTRVE